ncbi:MAG: hypothetical protein GXO59_03380 [Dictyoglomi bacterium]|nr:hypothetical protein [Dictyoglomota bacterium]
MMGFLGLGDQWASLLIVFPLLGAFLIPFVYAFVKNKKVSAWIAILTTGAGLIVAIDTLMKVLGGHTIEVIMGGYIPPMGINWRIDIWGALLTTLIYFIGFLATIYSMGYVKEDKWVQYFATMQVMIAGAVGVAMTGDLFNMFVFLEVASIAAYILVSTEAEASTLEASFKYLVLGSMATSFILLGIAILYGAYHTLNIYDIASKIGAHPMLDITAIALLLVGLGVEGAMFPLNSWLPDAHPSAPSPISAMLSGTLIKIGLVGIVRVLIIVKNTPYFDRILLILLVWGILTSLWGELSALRQKDVKRMLAHSSSAQMGYIVAALSTFTPIGIAAALMHMLVHALSKALLFMSTGSLIEGRHTRDIEGLKGSGRNLSGAMYAVGALSLMGLPPLPGFFSKFLILVSVYQKWGLTPVIFILLAAAVEIFYYLRLTAVLFDVGEKIKENGYILLSALLLGITVVVLGFMPHVLEHIATAGKDTLSSVLPYASLMPSGSFLIALGLLLGSAVICLIPGLRVVGILLGIGAGGYGVYTMLGATVPAVVSVLAYLAVFGVAFVHMQGDGKADGVKDALLFVAFASLLAVLNTSSMFVLLYFWELMSVMAFFMFLTESRRAMSGVYYSTMMTVLSYIFMVGIVALYVGTGSYAMSSLSYVFAAALVGVAMALKLGMFPLHVWAEYGYKEAHPVVAGYLSGAVSKVAFFLLFIAAAYATLPAKLNYILILLAGITVVWAGYRAIVADDLMGILAYSSISQMSYVLAGVLIGGAAMSGAWLHALGHAVFETGLFIVAYVILLIYGTTKIDELRGKGGVHPAIFYLAIVLFMSLAGVPPLSGFVSKWLMYQGALDGGFGIVAVLMMIGSAMSMMYGLRFIIALSGKPQKGGELSIVPLAIYSLITLGLGIYPWPFFEKLSTALAPFKVTVPLTWKELVLGTSGGGKYTALMIITLFVLSFILFLIFYGLSAPAERKGKVFRGGTFYEPTDENLPALSDMLWPMGHVGQYISYFDTWHQGVAFLTQTVADVLRGVYTGYLPDYALYVSITLAVVLKLAHI